MQVINMSLKVKEITKKPEEMEKVKEL